MTCRGRGRNTDGGGDRWRRDGDDKYARGWVELPAAVGVALWEASSKEAGVETPKKEKVREKKRRRKASSDEDEGR